jgi:hypothetical protein
MSVVRFVIASLALTMVVATSVQAQAGRRGDLLDVNTASEKQLLSVQGMTPALVKTLIARRPFQSMTDVDAVLAPSLSAAQRTETYRRLFLQINLNTASDAEILLIRIGHWRSSAARSGSTSTNRSWRGSSATSSCRST